MTACGIRLPLGTRRRITDSLVQIQIAALTETSVRTATLMMTRLIGFRLRIKSSKDRFCLAVLDNNPIVEGERNLVGN